MNTKKIFLTAIAIFGLSTITLAQLPSYVPTNGLVGWWPFTANANDSSGNGNHGTVNGATLTTDRFANANSAYSFNGNNFIIVNDASSLNMSSISISFWLQSNSNLYQSIIYKAAMNTANNEEFSVPLNYVGSNTLSFDRKNGSCSSGVGWVNLHTSAAFNVWKHVVLTHDGKTSKIYIDNNLVTSQTANFNIPNCPGGVLVFGISWDYLHGLFGKLDDVGIWNLALNHPQVTNLYNATPLGVNESLINNLFSVYPNPAKNEINVTVNTSLLGTFYTLYDITGNAVLSGKINSENTLIELGNLSGGIYLFSLGENLKQIFKIIKE